MDCDDAILTELDSEILFQQIDEDLDFAFALSLQEELNKDSQGTVKQLHAFPIIYNQHEMIHAYLFVTENNKDHDAHGPQFLSHMHRINMAAGTKIS
ncbi:hypothetical protein NPIL_592711, partial [Nephila pilipes]